MEVNRIENMCLWFVLVWLLSSVSVVLPNDETITRRPVKRSYVCPPHFVRLSHKCYFFSKHMATWQDAYWQCRDLHSNLAIIKNSNQDKLIRETLHKDSLVPLERWLGGLYDWEQMAWKWGASGKLLSYRGFANADPDDKEKLRWHCIIVDPTQQYRWSSRSCLEEKHFICHTKLKVVTNKDKKKLHRQYNVGKGNQLNEVAVPVLPEDNVLVPLKNFTPNGISNNFEETNELSAFAHTPKAEKRRKGGAKGRRNRNRNQVRASNGTIIYEVPRVKQGKHRMGRRRRNKSKEFKGDTSIEHIKWKTYYNDVTISPLHPRGIVEEFIYTNQ